jgi:hypothetical protein
MSCACRATTKPLACPEPPKSTMAVEQDPSTGELHRGSEAEVVAFLSGRSAPCPRCDYDLRDAKSAKCPECGEPLVLKLGSSRVRFGWLLIAMAPGCFSGIAAVFLMVPITVTLVQRLPAGSGAPWPVVVGDGFGFLSALAVVGMYRHRHRLMSWTARSQRMFAVTVWGIHVLVLVLLVLALAFWV